MPVEIKELNIRVTVTTGPAQQNQAGTGAPVKSSDSGGDKDALVAECVEQVLQILQSKRER
jgi:hypothetical protein